jgi:hypothetical protein
MNASQSRVAEHPACHAAHDPGTGFTPAARKHEPFAPQLGWPLASGLLGAMGLAALYLGIVALAESWIHALDLFREDAPFVVPIILGFGVQVGLFVHLRQRVRLAAGGRAAGALAGTSASTSTLGMVACCAHHLTDVLPLVGLSGATVFLAQHKVLFMAAGLLSNAIGIGVLLMTIRKARKATSAKGAYLS